MEIVAHGPLALTKMNWNNNALYDTVQVSMRRSQKLARIIAKFS